MYQTLLSLKTTSNNQNVVAMLAAACNLLVCATWMYAQRPRLPKQLGRLFEWGLEALLHLPDASVKIIDVYKSQSKQWNMKYITQVRKIRTVLTCLTGMLKRSLKGTS